MDLPPRTMKRSKRKQARLKVKQQPTLVKNLSLSSIQTSISPRTNRLQPLFLLSNTSRPRTTLMLNSSAAKFLKQNLTRARNANLNLRCELESISTRLEI